MRPKIFLYRHPFGDHLKYYGILPEDDIVGYSKKTKLTHIDYPLLFHPKKLKRLIKDVPTASDRLLINNNPMNEKQLKADADFWINCWNRDLILTSVTWFSQISIKPISIAIFIS